MYFACNAQSPWAADFVIRLPMFMKAGERIFHPENSNHSGSKQSNVPVIEARIFFFTECYKGVNIYRRSAWNNVRWENMRCTPTSTVH